MAEIERPVSASALIEGLEIHDRIQDGDADSGVDESTQAKENGHTPKQSRIPKKSPTESAPKRSRDLNPLDHRRMPRSKSVPKPPFMAFATPPLADSAKKVPMNKVVVGFTPSPNLKKVQSKVGSLQNTNHKPGGGQIKIETRKLEWNKAARTKTQNDNYSPGGGEKKDIEQKKLSWNAQSKVGSLGNTSHKPGGGTRKIESRKLDWNTESKVGSKNNLNHKPGGGKVQDLAARGGRRRRLKKKKSANKENGENNDASRSPSAPALELLSDSEPALENGDAAEDDEAANEEDGGAANEEAADDDEGAAVEGDAVVEELDAAD